MPRTKTHTIETLSVVDLAYAVRRLIAMRKTAENQVLKLASERIERIGALQAELKALTAGGAVPAVAPAAKAGRPVRKTRPAAKPAAKPVTKPKTAPAKPNLSAKLLAFRRVQGLYAGYLRGFTGATRERIRTINAEKGPAVALAEMKKLQATKGVPTKVAKTASATKAARKSPAGRKLHLSPERKAQLKMQGTYFGLMRGVPDAAKAKIKAISRDKGMKAAIEMMKKAGKK